MWIFALKISSVTRDCRWSSHPWLQEIAINVHSQRREAIAVHILFHHHQPTLASCKAKITILNEVTKGGKLSPQ